MSDGMNPVGRVAITDEIVALNLAEAMNVRCRGPGIHKAGQTMQKMMHRPAPAGSNTA